MGSTSSPGESRPEANDRSVSDLVKQLSEQTSTRVREELALARAEMTQKGKAAGVGAGMFGGAALVGLMALGALTAGLILPLAEVMDGWLAALIVAVGYGALAGFSRLSARARSRRRRRRSPSRRRTA